RRALPSLVGGEFLLRGGLLIDVGRLVVLVLLGRSAGGAGRALSPRGAATLRPQSDVAAGRGELTVGDHGDGVVEAREPERRADREGGCPVGVALAGRGDVYSLRGVAVDVAAYVDRGVLVEHGACGIGGEGEGDHRGDGAAPTGAHRGRGLDVVRPG